MLFARHGVSEVIVNTHYLSEQVSAFISAYNRRNTGLHVQEFYEPELLGSGGTVRANRNFIHGNEDFFICYADNLTNIDLSNMLALQQQKQGVLTMALFRASNPKQCGIATLDGHGTIVDFVEKPDVPTSNLANAGVYVASPRLFDYMGLGFCDFGKDVLPKLVRKMYGYEMTEYLMDIGTPDNLEKARMDWCSHDYI